MKDYLKYFKSVALGGIFLTPFIVLVVSSSLFFPFITGKNFLFRVIVEIVFGCWAVLAIYDKTYRPKKSALLYFLIAFIVGSTVSTFLGANPFKSFWSNYERMEGLVTFLHVFAYFLALSTILNTEKLWKAFFNTTIGASIIIFIYGLVQLGGGAEIHQGGVRLDASLGNAAYLAIYAVFHIFLAAILFFKEKRGFRWVYPPVALLGTFILYHTATRGAIIGFIGGVLLAGAILIFTSQEKKIKTVGAWTLAGILVVVAIFWFARNSNFVTTSPVLSRFSGISVSEPTTQSRLVIWKMAWQGFKERPLFGWGFENFNLIFNKYYQPILWRQEMWFDRAHNVFFDRLTTGGIVGLITYLGLFGSALHYLLLKRKELNFSIYESAIFVAMLAAYFVHNIFVFDNLISLMVFISVLAYLQNRVDMIGMENSIPTKKDSNNKNGGGDDYQKMAMAVVVILLSLYSIYYVNYRAYAANTSLLDALREDAIGGSPQGTAQNFKNAFDDFQKSVGYDSYGTPEAREHLSNFAIKAIGLKNLDDASKQQFYGFAVKQMEEQTTKFPGDIRYLLFLGDLYSRGGQQDLAIDTLQKAITLSPYKQQLYFELANSYLNKNDMAKSLETAKRVFEIDTSYPEARLVYSMNLILAGREPEAEQILKDGFGTVAIPNERLANVYASKKEFNKVAAIFEAIVAENPDNLDDHLKLAASYSELKQNDKAIAEIQKAIDLNPNFKQQGEIYIKQLQGGK